MSGDHPDDRPRFPKNKVHARKKRGDFKAKSHAGRQVHGAHRVFTQGLMDSYWIIVQTIRCFPQFTYTAGVLGIPLAGSPKINLTIEAAHLEKGILGAQAS